MIVGGYLLHLYCENDDCDFTERRLANLGNVAVEVTGESKAEAYANARKLGWRLRGTTAYCPECKTRRV